ncbi:MAG: DUF3592 domain-containing protein [Akkermansiaceae bacterium]|nr:DUF3592 domain-containing protein [Akkermansiaceae bacterium]
MSALFRKVVGRSRGSARSNKIQKGPAGFFFTLFGLPFLAGGLLAAYGYFHGFLKWREARAWVETPCEILSAELESRRGDDSTTYQATARYRYVFGGRTYESDRVGLSAGNDNIGDFQQRAHRELSGYLSPATAEHDATPAPPGKRFRCYVNPANPEQAVLYRDLRWEMQAFMAAFALIFPAVGAGFVAGGLVSVLDQRRRQRLAAAHPDHPWRWRPEWQETSIAEAPAKWRWGLYAFTVWGAAVAAPLVVATAACGAFARGGTAWLVMIYPALWCVPAGFSLRFLRRRLATGRARLDLERLPAAPGARLNATVVLGRRVRIISGAVATLRCERTISTRQGNKSSSHTETEWTHDETIDAAAVEAGLVGTRIPLRIAVPSGLPPSSPRPDDPGEEVKWTLRFKVPGTPVAAAFEIPVFPDPDAPPPERVDVSAAHGSRAVDLPDALAEERLVAEFDPEGRLLTLRSPFRRSLALFLFLLVFNLVWTGAAWLLIAQQAPLIFRVVWTGSAAIIWLVLLRLLLYRSTLTLHQDRLTIEQRLGPLTWRTHWERLQTAGFPCDSNIQQNGRDLYRLRARSATGRHLTLASGITSRTTAMTLAHALTQWRGETPGPSAPP